MPLGVTWSKRMSIHRRICRTRRHRIKAAGGKFQYRIDFITTDVKLFDNLLYCGSGFKILEHGRYGHAGIAKHPCAAESSRYAFDDGALRPIETCHIACPSVSFYHGKSIRENLGLVLVYLHERIVGVDGMRGFVQHGYPQGSDRATSASPSPISTNWSASALLSLATSWRLPTGPLATNNIDLVRRAERWQNERANQ